MAEIQAQAKKTTVRNLATEINISHDTLIEFLQKKGFADVKSIMSKVGEDALELVMKQFGKEKDVSDKRQKKIAAFKEKQVLAKEPPAAKEAAKPAKKGAAKPAPKKEAHPHPEKPKEI